MTLTHTTLPGPVQGLLAVDPGADLASAGYVESEHVAAGRALRYGGDPVPQDGRAEVHVVDTASFATRVAVRRPADVERFSGVVVCEWLNVSSGNDAAPDWTYLGQEVVRRGHVWVGISAQRVGVEGGASAVGPADDGNGLKRTASDRYRDLDHPGDGYCYDIFTQVAASVAHDGAPLAGWPVRHRIAVGESQSAFALTTYVDAVHPVADCFDAFLVHSRGAFALPLGEPDAAIDLAAARAGGPVLLRDDLTTPVLVVQTETDVATPRFDYWRARQDDGPWFRLWEVAGTAHADHWQIGELEGLLGLPDPVNRGQQAYVLRAGLRALVRWLDDGTPPPTADRLRLADVGSGAPRLVLDDLGNALGGVRTPCVDAAVQRLTGIAADDAPLLAGLFGRTLPIADDALRNRYPDGDSYLASYRAATERAIADGFVLSEDRDAVLAEARPDALPPDHLPSQTT